MATDPPAGGRGRRGQFPGEHPFLRNNERTGTARGDAVPNPLPLAREPDSRQGPRRSPGIALRDVAVLPRTGSKDDRAAPPPVLTCEARGHVRPSAVPHRGGLGIGPSDSDLSSFTAIRAACPAPGRNPHQSDSDPPGLTDHRSSRAKGDSQEARVRPRAQPGLRLGSRFQGPSWVRSPRTS